MNPQASTDTPLLLGVLVGGLASRMGGLAKGLLRTPSGVTIVESLAAEFRALVPQGHVVLLGEHTDYAHLGFPQHADIQPSQGPIGGAHALLTEAARSGTRAVLVGCDMPFVDRELFETLMHAHPDAPAVAPRSSGHWEPLFSRLTPGPALDAMNRCLKAERYSLQHWLNLMNCTELELNASQRAKLRDWDSPDDMSR